MLNPKVIEMYGDGSVSFFNKFIDRAGVDVLCQ